MEQQAGVSPAAAVSGHDDRAVDRIADRFLDDLLRADPVAATRVGDHRWDDRLPDLSEQGRAQAESSYRTAVDEMEGIPPEGLGDEARITREVVIICGRNLLDFVAGKPYQLAVDHQDGIQNLPTEVARYHSAQTDDGLESLLSRYSAFPMLVQQHVQGLREGLEEGRTSPGTIVDRTIGAVDELLATSGESSPIIELLHIEVGESRKRVAGAVDRWILPALASFRAFLANEYQPHARQEAGLWATPGGESVYRSAIKLWTTLDLEPQEIHLIGLEEVERIKAEMEDLARQLGYPDRRTARKALAETPPAEPEQLLEMARSQVRSASLAAVRWFTHMPAQPCAVAPVEPFRQAVDAGASYFPGTADGSRPGTYFLNAARAAWIPTWLLPALSFHETVPGHHLQSAIELERKDASRFRRIGSSVRYDILSGFSEGWGLYAERLADEMGLYQTPQERFGMLEAQDGRAQRLVLDTGIHALGWTRETAVGWMVEADDGVTPRELAEQVLDRYIAWPAQALSYKLGQRVIEAARRQAAEELGSEFDLRVFHDEVIGHGSIPLPILTGEIVRWMRLSATHR